MKKRNGFTLIEVLIVLVIIALLTVGALTVLNTYRTNAKDDEEKRNNLKVGTGLVLECYSRGNTFLGCDSGLPSGGNGVSALNGATWDIDSFCIYVILSGTRYVVVGRDGVESTANYTGKQRSTVPTTFAQCL